jgi:exodeoxyribonuclease VII large subunit
MSQTDPQVYTVTEFTTSLKYIVEKSFPFIRIIGEISSLRRPLSGHVYFNLKDDSSSLRCVLFKSRLFSTRDELADGTSVICFGRISIYEPRGEYQLIVDTVDMRGSGYLQAAFEKLKQQLLAEGLFDQHRKKPIPPHICDIAVITSATGAALHDFLTICRHRQADVRVRLIPATVQGAEAPAEICAALAIAQRLEPQVIVLCRGGGSLEDLWCFNDERVARAIAGCTVPVVTGIGHETDFTIADFCADQRTATPTAAAELLIPDARVLRARIGQLNRQIIRMMLSHLDTAHHRIVAPKRLLASFDAPFYRAMLSLETSHRNMAQSFLRTIEQLEKRTSRAIASLTRHSPIHVLRMQHNHCVQLHEDLIRAITTKILRAEALLSRHNAVLSSLSPLAVLARGYAIVSMNRPDSRQPHIVSDSRDVSLSERLNVTLHRGSLECEVLGKREAEDETGQPSSSIAEKK